MNEEQGGAWGSGTAETRPLRSGYLQVREPRNVGPEMLACELLKLQAHNLSDTSSEDEYEKLARKCAKAAAALYDQLGVSR